MKTTATKSGKVVTITKSAQTTTEKVENAKVMEKEPTAAAKATAAAAAEYETLCKDLVFKCWKNALRKQPLSSVEERKAFLSDLRKAYTTTKAFTIVLTNESGKTDEDGTMIERYEDFATLADKSKYYSRPNICTISSMRTAYNSFLAYKAAAKAAAKKAENAELYEKAAAILNMSREKVDLLGLSTVRDILAKLGK